jgi:hypothetical protein
MLMAVHGNRYRQFLLEHGSVQGMLLTELEGPAARVLRTIRESGAVLEERFTAPDPAVKPLA